MPPPALRAGAPRDQVIYVGSLSKSLSPGLRLGYMVAPPDFIREARALRGMMIRHPSPFIQLTAAQFIRLGHHDALLSKLKSIYERRWYVADAALKRIFPEATVTGGWGGTNFMVAAPLHANLEQLVEQSLEAGVVMDPMKPCFMNPEDGANRFRIGVSAIGVNRITTGLEKLRSVYDRLG